MENRVALTAEQSREGRSSTASHTPGPWTAGPTASLVWRVFNDSKGNRVHQPVADCTVPALLTVEEKKANAALIAAAPDLLRACEDCMKDRGDWSAVMYAAIQKARGEQ